MGEAYKHEQKEVEWLGVKYPISILASEFNLERFYYEQAVSNEMYLKKALERDGLSRKDLQEVIGGKYRKTEDALDEAQEKLAQMEKEVAHAPDAGTPKKQKD